MWFKIKAAALVAPSATALPVENLQDPSNFWVDSAGYLELSAI